MGSGIPRRALVWAALAAFGLGASDSALAATPVTASQTCAPTTITTTEVSHCTVTIANDATSVANTNLDITGPGLDYSNVASPGTAGGGGVTWDGSLAAAVRPHVTSITAGGGVAGSYLPLSLFSIPTFPAGDDAITNFDVEPFYYGGERYTRIGVSSNGYIIVGGGGGDPADNQSVPPAAFPNAARPNNVLAPFWTDLNPKAAGGVRIGVLTDGVSRWTVVDWEGVKNFANATIHSFAVWMRVDDGGGPASEQITFSYGPNGAGNPTGTNWGAENRDGSSGASIATLPSNIEYRVNTSPPVAGGTQMITYDIAAKAAGTFTSTATATSNVSVESSSSPQTITVTKTAATLAPDVSALNRTFDGTPKPVDASTDPPDLEGVRVTYDGSNKPPVHPGSYEVVASLDNPGYSAADATGELVIAPAAVDRTPPETRIDASPTKKTTKTRAKFAFSSSESGSSFECRLDAGAWTACTSPAKFKNLDPGRHRFQVRAKDPSGNVDASPATKRWRITP